MEKQKRWQFWLITAVLLVTLYNVLPTIFWYSKPLKQPIDKEYAHSVAKQAMDRINDLEPEAVAWLQSFSDLLHVQSKNIKVDKENPRFIHVGFENQRAAKYFQQKLKNAGVAIPFVPAQLQPTSDVAMGDDGLYTVVVERKIGTNFTPEKIDELFTFSNKMSESKEVEPFYKELIYSRVKEIIDGVAGPSNQAKQVQLVINHPGNPQVNEMGYDLAKEINEMSRVFQKNPTIQKRAFQSFSQIDVSDKKDFIRKFTASLEAQKNAVAKELESATAEHEKALLKKQSETLSQAIKTINANIESFTSGKSPLTPTELNAKLKSSFEKIDRKDYIQTVDLSGYNPYIKAIAIDWTDDKVIFHFFPDITKIQQSTSGTEAAALQKEGVNQIVFNMVASVSQASDETIKPRGDVFVIDLNSLTNSKSVLAMKLGTLANMETAEIVETLQRAWNPEHPELKEGGFPLRTWEEYSKASPQDQKMGAVIFAPVNLSGQAPEGFGNQSIYVVVRGLKEIYSKYQQDPNSKEAQTLASDVDALQELLKQEGYFFYYGRGPEPFTNDLIFHRPDYYNDLLGATREDFYVKGDKKFAVLEFTDVEQRMVATNRIEDKVQEDLVSWEEAYQSSKVNLDPEAKLITPAPTKNPYWQNLMLTARKYFRGDDRKILKWGLDLSGGKTVRIGLKDQNNRAVTNPDDINQAVNELYTRINRMGVSERTIRSENDSIILDFPGSQAFSASELVKASAMYFNIVNEQFSRGNPEIGNTVNAFLQGVWNEAVVTNRKDVESVNEIAWRHLGGDPENPELNIPKSENAKILWEQGLRIANPTQSEVSAQFNDKISKIAVKKGEEMSEWNNSHPLMVVFNNYALEGSSLSDVRVGFDPKQGNMLTFSVKSSYESGGRYGSPRQDLYNWTSQFAEDKIQGTPREVYSPRGWKMAVVLNGRVISAPELKAALSDTGSISGRFTTREINQLAADLKAGSLTYTPRILSEQNVSPELGKEERTKGIAASIIALFLVVGTMIGVYRYAGFIASVAVMINLLIMWGILQSIGAALTLPGIAGIVLTIGMAVDANVLVFERIREEFSVSGRIGSAIQAGYKKAFSAIVDSNITTLMAAVILIQFDSGPIKAFAVMLIIGILSSMFTALFMTRYYFTGWAENPKNKELKMAKLFNDTKIDFLSYTKPAVVISLVVMLVGSWLLVTEKNTIFGMDFTGGYSITLDLDETGQQNYRVAAKDALVAAGATSSEVEVRELSRPNQLRIQMGISMEEDGHPFYGMVTEESGSYTYGYQYNPRIVWVVDALAKQGLNVQQSQLQNLDKNWSVMSGQLSDAMRNNAVIALLVALAGVLLYITYRFEFKYAVGAVVALGHDVVITLGIVALFHFLGFPVEINLQAIGAIMTIIGYSLNDTIIVFDRIREDVRLHRKWKFTEVINHALNVTLNRTIMTSGTTLLVLLSLVLFGGTSLFGFSLIMLIGVLIGTISSLFVASPIMLWVHNWEASNGRGEALS